MNAIQCYLSCLVESGLIYPFVGLLGVTITCLFVFLINRKYGSLLGSQTFMTITITLSLFSMQCDMFQWLWIYLGIIFIGTLIISIVKHYITLQISYDICKPSPFISKLKRQFKVPIYLLDTQKIKAFAYQKKIYLSIGLLERLNNNEIKAVVAHEKYHLYHSPNKILSSFLALTSLTFLRYGDEYNADRYAAKTAGINNLINALKKLEIRDYNKRVRMLYY